ncbi:hypothetical protein [Angelakisella massiliensis]|uniref:hypothetical protein n=1 Tax=Angelakisella massiliensis TaxID=1871018 RepID=UPI0011143EC2|nr:hypothetical protein [Angelakisella massiliensis]
MDEKSPSSGCTAVTFHIPWKRALDSTGKDKKDRLKATVCALQLRAVFENEKFFGALGDG